MAIKYTQFRFLVLFLYGSAQIILSIHFNMQIPIVNKLLKVYPSSTVNSINYLPMSFMLLMGVFIPLCGWFIEKYGLRKAMLLGTGMILVGAILNSFINYSFVWIIVG